MKFLYTINPREIYLERPYCTVGAIPIAVLPRFVKSMELMALSYEDNAGRNDIRKAIMTFLADLTAKLEEPVNRVYRLLDTHLSGAEYALNDDVVEPAIPVVPSPGKTLLQQLLDLRGAYPTSWFAEPEYGSLADVVKSLRQVSPDQKDNLLDKLDLLGDADNISGLWQALRGTAADAADVSIEGAALIAQLVSSAAILQALGLMFTSQRLTEELLRDLVGSPAADLPAVIDAISNNAASSPSLAVNLENIAQLLGALPSPGAEPVVLPDDLCEPPAKSLCKIGRALSRPEPVPSDGSLCPFITPDNYGYISVDFRNSIVFTASGTRQEFFRLGDPYSTTGYTDWIPDLFVKKSVRGPNGGEFQVIGLRYPGDLAVCVEVGYASYDDYIATLYTAVRPEGEDYWVMPTGVNLHSSGLSRQTTTVVMHYGAWYCIRVDAGDTPSNVKIRMCVNTVTPV